MERVTIAGLSIYPVKSCRGVDARQLQMSRYPFLAGVPGVWI